MSEKYCAHDYNGHVNYGIGKKVENIDEEEEKVDNRGLRSDVRYFFYLYFPPSSQLLYIIIYNIIAGTTVKNKGKLILTEIFPSVQNHDIF